jgi:hypothetical protein
VDEDEIEAQVSALRKKLLADIDKAVKVDARGLKPHQVHELAAAKMVESERLRNALGISKDYEEGSHWRRQEEEKVRRLEQREKLDAEGGERERDRDSRDRRDRGDRGDRDRGDRRRRSMSPRRRER